MTTDMNMCNFAAVTDCGPYIFLHISSFWDVASDICEVLNNFLRFIFLHLSHHHGLGLFLAYIELDFFSTSRRLLVISWSALWIFLSRSKSSAKFGPASLLSPHLMPKFAPKTFFLNKKSKTVLYSRVRGCRLAQRLLHSNKGELK